MKHLAHVATAFIVVSVMIMACSKKQPTTPSNNNNNTGNPKTDYLKIGSVSFTNPSNFKVTAGFVGSTRKTELKVNAGLGANKDTFFSVKHDTVIVDFPCKSGLGQTLPDSCVYFYSRLSFLLGAPILATIFTGDKYGSYVIRMENGKRVSYFSGIELEDNQTKKRYTCEGRITWP